MEVKVGDLVTLDTGDRDNRLYHEEHLGTYTQGEHEVIQVTKWYGENYVTLRINLGKGNSLEYSCFDFRVRPVKFDKEVTLWK